MDGAFDGGEPDDDVGVVFAVAAQGGEGVGDRLVQPDEGLAAFRSSPLFLRGRTAEKLIAVRVIAERGRPRLSLPAKMLRRQAVRAGIRLDQRARSCPASRRMTSL